MRYEYGFCADDQRFTEEWLYAYPSARKQMWFEREGDELKFGEHLHGENRTIEKITRPNSLFLSAAAQNRHAQLTAVFSTFASVRNYNLGTLASPLTDFHPRKEENLERGYLQGRYGAIPFLQQLIRDPE